MIASHSLLARAIRFVTLSLPILEENHSSSIDASRGRGVDCSWTSSLKTLKDAKKILQYVEMPVVLVLTCATRVALMAAVTMETVLT